MISRQEIVYYFAHIIQMTVSSVSYFALPGFLLFRRRVDMSVAAASSRHHDRTFPTGGGIAATPPVWIGG
jgi:hypothetical protein